MKQHKPFYAVIIIGVVLFIALLTTQYIREDRTITLPVRTTETETETGDNKPDTENLNILSITPATVQAAVSTLSRPASYQRTQTVTLCWNGGESTTTSHVAVSGKMMRIDTQLKDGTICHILLRSERACVWYDNETNWVCIRADELSSDALQRMPTYETVLSLDSSRIVHAEYCLKDNVYCIYIQTAPDQNGYVEHYWISGQSGLLYAAERTQDGRVIYRFTATEPGNDTPDESLFLLPDGALFPIQ